MAPPDRDPCVQGEIEASAGSPSANTQGANAPVTPASLPSGSGVDPANPRLSKPTIWARLREALTALEKSTCAIPPLHSLAHAVLGCLDIFEAATPNDRVYEILAGQLNAMANTLDCYATLFDSEPPSGEMTRIAESIQRYTTEINQGRQPNRRSLLFESVRDQEDIACWCHKIQGLSQELQTVANKEILLWIKQESEDNRLKDLGQVDDARYNSRFTWQRRRGCTAGTRTGVQNTIKAWARNPKGPKIFWMSGMPGMGKTAISHSLCEWLEDEELLGASYFCTRTSPVCSGLGQLIPTIAYQLADSLPRFRRALCKALKRHRGCHSLEPQLQFKRLLSEPLQEAKDQIPENKVIVIDGLDEYEDDRLIEPILQPLLNISVELPIRILITSRPEPLICNLMSTARYTPETIDLHDRDPSEVREDIKKYLTESLRGLPVPPTEEQIERLADLSGNLFIHAATVVAYVRPHHMGGNPKARLEAVLMTDSSTGLGTEPNDVYKSLHLLYSTVLKQTQKKEPTEKELENLQSVMWTVICAKETMTPKTLAGLLGIEEEDVMVSLSFLHSVLYTPEDGGRITVLHTSFSDFIRNPSQPTVFHCNESLHHAYLAQRCFELMRSQLEFNICGLETSFRADSDVPDLERRVEERISVELSYACRYWSYHLLLAPFSPQLHSMLLDFVSTQLLYWMEVLNLQKCIGMGGPTLSSARSWLPEGDDWVVTKQELVEALIFVTRFASNSSSKSTPHIYLSTLAFCPRSSSVYRNYWPRTRRLLNITGSTVNRIQDAALARWFAEAPVSALVCSWGGDKTASGSHDGTIRVWDTHTGTIIKPPMKGHNGRVSSLKFSRDGSRLASGSSDGTICLYDVSTTDIRTTQRLVGQEGGVHALHLSSNGSRVTSVSGNGAVWSWDTETGVVIKGLLAINESAELYGGTLQVLSIAFSSDGRRVIAGGSYTRMTEHTSECDPVIQSWDISTPDKPKFIRSFFGHNGPILSVDYSSDDKYIVTGGSDRTVRLWEADTGIPIDPPFKGHTGEILVVKFSPEGTRVFSGSVDRTVRVWDINAGSGVGQPQPFEGHSSAVATIVPLPDGTRVISGSDDATIRMWYADTVMPASLPVNAHSGSICSVTFSANSDLILSGSEDNSARVWDVHTGILIGTPILGYTDAISSVAFSSDNTCFAAGSRDGTFLIGGIDPVLQFGEPIPRTGHNGPVRSVVFSSNGLLVTGSYDRSIKTWDPKTLSAVGQPFSNHGGPVTAVASACRGSNHLLLSACGDNMIRLYDTSTGAIIVPPFSGHESSVLSIACSPTAACVVSGSYDKTIRVWDGYTGAQ
ncbi:hypothetical protein FRC11_006551, partial [Ceratobasidium sp. 423]